MAAEPMDSRATYGEARFYMRWMRAVTPSSLAGAMAVHVDVAARFIWVAADIYGILEDTGIGLDGTGDVEPLYRYKPLPPGPTEHPTQPPPERTTPGVYDRTLVPVRGLPIRMVDDDRKRASTPGERHKMVMRQRRFEEQQQAKMAAAEATRRRRQALASGSHRDRLKLLREGGRR